MIMAITSKQIESGFLIIVLLLSIYMTFSAFNTKMLGEDEEIYKFLGEKYSKGEVPVYYTFNFGKDAVPLVQPIFVELIFSIFFMVFGSSMALSKAIVSVFAFLTMLVVYLIGRRYNMWYGIASVSVLLTLQYFSHFSLMSYVEIPIAFFSALTIYLTLSFSESFKKWEGVRIEPIILGIILAISYFTKVSGLLLVIFTTAYIAWLWLKHKDKNYLKNLFVVLLTFGAMMAVHVIKNLMLYRYPFFEPINFLFPYADPIPAWITSSMSLITPVSLSISNVIASFGWVPFVLMLFSIAYLMTSRKSGKAENTVLELSLLSIILFLAIFSVAQITHFTILEYRHFSLIYPQIALLGGFILWKLKESNKMLMLALIAIALLGFYTSISIIGSSSSQTRYSQPYLESLDWIKQNTSADSVLLTTYIGSAMEYSGHQRILWSLDELQDVMNANDADYIYNTLKDHNVSYVLVWKQLISQTFIVPQANLLGTFTYNFMDKTINDKRFEQVFSNSEVLIYKLS